MKFSQRLKAGFNGFKAAFAPTRYNAGGIQVRCSHCQGEMFRRRQANALLWDWASGVESTWLVCDRCGLIRWFAKSPE
jgi:hypothetical protein